MYKKMEEEINFAKIEKKWQDRWEKEKTFETKNNSKKKKCYVLEMFPYPSATGLHMGHAFNFTIGDVFSRFRRMQGFEVLHPMGFDSLGLPAENAAIKVGQHPEDYTNNSIKNFVKQQNALGLTYDWSRMVNTADPDYYKWDQWIFLKMFEKGLVYQKEAAVNWCPKCDTILANEQVQNGKCWRHEDTEVEIKQMNQWYLKITDYADRLLEGHKGLKWPEKTIAMQKNWIGKSFGTEIDFEIEDKNISNVVIVHGSPSRNEKSTNSQTRTYDKHWMPWIKKELTDKCIECKTPLMPEPWEPDYKDWKKEFEKLTVNENSILIGHSSGGGFLVRWLGETNRKIKKLILVAPAIIHSGEWKPLEKLLKFEINNKIKENIGKIIIFISDNDSTGIRESARIFHEKLGAELIELKNHGHFTRGDMGTEEFPELLNVILNKKWPIFTTRPDTIFGVTFMVVSAQHQKLMDLVTKEQKPQVEKFLKKLKSVSEKEMADMEKEGVFTGSYAINPANGDKVPVYAGNFVVADYGAGMVMAVPAHDQRDFEFAKKYNIPIKEVIMPVFGEKHENEEFRRTISVVVHRKKDDKFLYLKWKKFNWISPVIGGTDNDDDLKAAEREVLEETGYKVKAIRKLGGETEEHFFAENKGVWRYRINQPILCELVDEKQNAIQKEESEKHEVVWLTAEEALEKTTHKYNNFGILSYIGKDIAYTESGKLVNSKEFNGISNEEAKKKISEWLESKKIARKVVNYKLRDWSVARQRYWGTPIPLIHCDKCGIVPVPEKYLPVKLPREVKFGKGNPLLTNEKWLNVKCPKCNGKARREANTMDTFVNSSWYFLRYCDPHNNKEIFDKKNVKYWMPVDLYIGGAEHACMHLIYSRFYTMFLHDIGLVDFEEPASRLFHQGMINGTDGEKMSKSKGNGVEPLETIAKYGVDATRFFLLSEASPDKGFNWSDKGIQGSVRIINKIWRIAQEIKFGKDSEEVSMKLNKTIKNVSEQIENLDYRKSTIELRELFDLISKSGEVSKDSFGKALKLLSPFCPHIAEELWEELGNKDFISTSEWPKYVEIKEKKSEEDLNEKFSFGIKSTLDRIQDREVKKIYLYVMPFEISLVDKKKIEKSIGKPIEIFAVNDPKKYDPENRAKKAVPGRPGMFVE